MGWRAAFLVVGTPGVVIAVAVYRLREPTRDVASYVSLLAERSPRDLARGLREMFALGESRLLSGSELERIRVRADQVAVVNASARQPSTPASAGRLAAAYDSASQARARPSSCR